MHTPSLRRRIMASGVAAVSLLLVVVGAFVYFILQERLENSLDEVLDARLGLALELGEQHGSDGLAVLLQARGVPATVTSANGVVEEAEPVTPRFRLGPPGPLADVPHPRVSRGVELTDGTTVEVYATRAGVDATMRRLLLLLISGSALALAIAVILFRRAAAYSIGPLEHVVAAAGRTASGQTGERLQPDDPNTELGRMAVAYDRMLESLEAALADTRAAEERTRRFVDDAAHQLRTPLAAIRGSVEALLQESDPQVRDRLLSNLVRETARSNRLMTSLLTIARIDQDHIGELAATDLDELCVDEVERASSLAPEVTISYDPSPPASGAWLLDERATREILANLLDNARRHAQQTVSVGTALVPTEGGNQVVELRVRDDGPGIPPDATELVFDRFTTLDGHGGSGLGLPIARALARSQGGELTYRDGAFVVRLPAQAAAGARSTVDPRTQDVLQRHGQGTQIGGRDHHGTELEQDQVDRIEGRDDDDLTRRGEGA